MLPNSDKLAFKTLLDEMAEIYGRQPLSVTLLAAYWNVIAPRLESLEAFSRACSRHLQTEKFFPKPVELIEALERMEPNGLPGPEEAWSIALRAFDEDKTLIWTDEIAQARTAADPLMRMDDAIGARMVFLETYRKLAEESRMSGQKPVWTVSLGFDKHDREETVQQAVAAGRLTHAQAQRYLPEPEISLDESVKQLIYTGNVVAHPALAEAERRKQIANIQKLKAMLAGQPEAGDPIPSADAVAKAQTAERVSKELKRLVEHG